jgi:hypothetical protein
MLIQNTQPVVVPQVEAKTYPHFWVSRIIIDTPSATDGRVHIELSAYNSDTKEILNSSRSRIDIENIWSAAAENPTIANAMNAILQAVNELKNPTIVESVEESVEEPQ